MANPALGYHTISASLINALTYTTTAGTTQATGSSFFVAVATRSGASQPTFSADTYSNSYTLLSPTTGTNPENNTGDSEPNIWMFKCLGGAGGASHTVTITTTAANIAYVNFVEVTNAATVDVSAMAYDGSGANQYFINPVTPSAAGEFVLGFATSGGGTGIMATNNGAFTLLDSVSSTYCMASAYQANAAASSQSPLIGTTNHTTYKWVGATLAIAGSGGGGGGGGSPVSYYLGSSNFF
jgi:hypothetical protein